MTNEQLWALRIDAPSYAYNELKTREGAGIKNGCTNPRGADDGEGANTPKSRIAAALSRPPNARGQVTLRRSDVKALIEVADEYEMDCHDARARLCYALSRSTPFWLAWGISAVCAVGAAIGGWLIR